MSIETSFLFDEKNIFEKVGGFDPIYFFYDEDTDLSLRVQKMGYKNAVYREVFINTNQEVQLGHQIQDILTKII